MVQAMKGVVLKGDVPLKQFVLSLNEARAPSERFVIADLDDTTLFIQPQAMEFLKEKLEVFTEQNQYQPPLRPGAKKGAGK